MANSESNFNQNDRDLNSNPPTPETEQNTSEPNSILVSNAVLSEFEMKELALKSKEFGFEIIKFIVISLGAIIIFFSIQYPNVLSSTKDIDEKVKKERANMLLDLLIKEDDPNKILLGIQLIKIAYKGSEVDKMLIETEDKIASYSEADAQTKLRAYYNKLLEDRKTLKSLLNDTEDKDKKEMLAKQVKLLDSEIEDVEKELSD